MNKQSPRKSSLFNPQWYMDKIQGITSVRNLIWLLVIVLLYVYLNLFSNALIDDAFITLTYVKTLLTSGTWGFFPGYITNTATSPFNVLLLSFFGIFVGPTVKAQILLALLSYLVIIKSLINISMHLFNKEIYGYLGAVGFISNPLILSTIGLESILFAALMLVAINCYLTKKWNWLAVVLGLLTITRLEAILFFAVFFIFTPTQLKIRILGIYLLAIAPWYIFSWIYLGSIIPDTFFIKVAQNSWDQWNFFKGIPIYLRIYPYETFFSFSFLPLILLYFNKHVRKNAVLTLIFFVALFHFITYTVLQVWPFHWYYVPLITMIILFGMISLGAAYQNTSPRSWQGRVLQGVLVICFLVPTFGMVRILAQDQFVVAEMPIHTNWATHEEYKEIGLWLKNRDLDGAIDLKGEIGTIAYYCDCYLLDVFSNRDWAREVIDENAALSGVRPFLLRTNFNFYVDNPDLPEKEYLLWLGYAIEDSIKEWEISSKWNPEGIYTFDHLSNENQ